jgi:toxin ParE1/3/4
VKPVRFLPGAEADALAASKFYDERQPGLGDDFEVALDAAVSRLLPAEQHLQVGDADGVAIRRAPLGRRFPHRVVFVDLPAEVLVVAVEHPGQKPDYWLGRV